MASWSKSSEPGAHAAALGAHQTGPIRTGRPHAVVSRARAPLDVPNATAAVAQALARPSNCVPVGGVMLSMSNPHHLHLRQLQFARIKHIKCLMDRVVSVCWGDWDDDLGTCVRGDCGAKTKYGGYSVSSACVSSDYRRSQYVSLNWAKWPFFIDALRVARVILWIEADIVINRNPWEGLAGVPGVDARWLVRHDKRPPPDVAYQWEKPPCNPATGFPRRNSTTWVPDPGVVCGNTAYVHNEPLNCGQLLITSRSFAQAVWDSRPAEFQNGAPSQQHHANVIKANFSHDGLPLDFFNYCWGAKSKNKPFRFRDRCKMVSVHATCAENLVAKEGVMRKWLGPDRFEPCLISNQTGRLMGNKRKLDQAALAQRSAVVVAMLNDSNAGERALAVQTLGTLDAAVLAQHAPTVTAMLDHSLNLGVREAAVQTLGQLDAATLAQHAPALVAKLEDRSSAVRRAVLEALGKVDAASLVQHKHALANAAKDRDNDVRAAAATLLVKLLAVTEG